ncbi:hypothetical protein OIV83_005684 [Microbotryomycetes sp. JL201]|nr:hypothetical protein OIV83_005684 [Microbotryomycetes sp. JL201]
MTTVPTKPELDASAASDSANEHITGYRYTTPTPDAARSLPTPHAQSPPTTPPLSSIQAFLASRDTSPSPRKKRRLDNDVPLSSCVPVGTLLLRRHKFTLEGSAETAGDGWLIFKKGAIESEGTLDQERVKVEPSDVQPLSLPEASPVVTPKTSCKRRRSHSKTPTRLSAAQSTESAVQMLLHLQDALVARVTFKGRDDGTIVCRVYLVPQDANTLGPLAPYARRRARPAESTINSFLARINTNREAWHMNANASDTLDLLVEQDRRSILELYRQVESPDADPNFVDKLENAMSTSRDRIAAILDHELPGLKTRLYEYQAASLAKMLQRELAPQYTIDPAFIKRTSSIDNSDFWLSVRGVVMREPPYVLEPKAGILAEEMGSGKTCICLALILATVRDLPDLSDTPTYLDGSEGSPDPVMMTHLSRNFPFKRELAVEQSLLPRVPPPLLAPHEMDAYELEAYELALEQQARRDAKRQRPPVPSLRTLMIDYVRTSSTAIHYSSGDAFMAGTSLPEELEDCNPFYNLLPSPVQLASRTGRSGTTNLPTQIIVSCATLVVVPAELVTQWVDELGKHVEDKALRVLVLRTVKDEFKTAQQLAQYDLVLMSIKRFSDACDDAASPLRRVHWKRLIVDEGHALAGKNRLREFAESLRCECRWAISGTPTTNLRGATSGNEGALFAHEQTTGGTEADYDRIGKLMSLFLRHEAFPDSATWRSVFTDPILKLGRGSERLARTMNSCIVRNDPEVLKKAYQLPPLTSHIVHVHLEEAERKTYNALIGVFSSNAILSQREDDDYFFHPKQRRALDQVMENLAASSFFFASSEFYEQLSGAIERSKAELQSDRSASWSNEDRVALVKAINVMQEALDDTEWRAVAGSVAVNLDVYNLDSSLVKAFDGVSSDNNPRRRTIMPLGSLVNLRRAMQWLRRSDNVKWRDDEELAEELATHEAKRKREEAAAKSNKAVPEPTESPKKRKKGEVLEYVSLPSHSVFHAVTLGATSTSAKLNHVVSELRKYPDEKFIVFASSLPDLAFASLSEALDLLGIKHLIFTSHGKGKDRGAIAAKFNSTSARECQAVLVDARLGGRGINLTAASRVVMLEPIWQPDLEVQAARRAHRLGQKKPVDLSVLVVPGTYEEAMLRRRSQLDATDFTSTTKLPQRDSQLQQLLQSAQYLEPRPHAMSNAPRVRMFSDDHLPPLLNSRTAKTKSDGVKESSPNKHGPSRPKSATNAAASVIPTLTALNGALDGSPPVKVRKAVQFAI